MSPRADIHGYPAEDIALHRTALALPPPPRTAPNRTNAPERMPPSEDNAPKGDGPLALANPQSGGRASRGSGGATFSASSDAGCLLYHHSCRGAQSLKEKSVSTVTVGREPGCSSSTA